VIVRRRVEKDNTLLIETEQEGPQSFGFVDAPDNIKLYEYAVLLTSLEDDIISIVQHYRDRADCENIFDEIKNQWGWGGYTTQDLKSIAPQLAGFCSCKTCIHTIHGDYVDGVLVSDIDQSD